MMIMSTKKKSLKWYGVLSPLYEYEDTISTELGGPRYKDQEWLVVQCYNTSEARSIAVRHWTRKYRSDPWHIRKQGYIYNIGGNPYKGVTVTRVEEPDIGEVDVDNDEFYIKYKEKDNG